MQAFFDDLVEVPVRADEQKSLTRDTTDMELQRIATRTEEAAAQLPRASSGSPWRRRRQQRRQALPSARSLPARKILPVLKLSRASPARKSLNLQTA